MTSCSHIVLWLTDSPLILTIAPPGVHACECGRDPDLLINSRQGKGSVETHEEVIHWLGLLSPGRERPSAAPPVDTMVLAPGRHGYDAWMLAGAGGFSSSPSPTRTRDLVLPQTYPVLHQTYPVSAPYQDPGFCMARSQTLS